MSLGVHFIQYLIFFISVFKSMIMTFKFAIEIRIEITIRLTGTGGLFNKLVNIQLMNIPM